MPSVPPSGLSEFQQLIVEAATRVQGGAASLQEAAEGLGLTVDAFKSSVTEVLALRNRFNLPLVSGDQWGALRAIASAAESEAAPIAAAGGGLAATESSTGLLATVAGWFGVSVGTLLVGTVVLGAVAVGGVVWYNSRGSSTAPTAADGAASPTAVSAVISNSPTAAARTSATVANTCAVPVKEARLCPWSPKGAKAEPCGPGFCWDGGFNGSLACKQETLPANAGRNDTNGAKCEAGYTAQVDACTNVVLACAKK